MSKFSTAAQHNNVWLFSAINGDIV